MAYTVFLTILTMLLYAVPGFLLVKTKMVKTQAVSAFSVVLMYVLQPCLTIHSFQKITFTPTLAVNMLICFSIALIAMGTFLGLLFFLLRKKQEDVTYRVATVASVFGNASFIGIPILEAVVPECTEAAAYSIVFFLAMSALGWTVASAVITRDKKYISVKKILFNPATLSLIAAVLLGLIDVFWAWKIPEPFAGMFEILKCNGPIEKKDLYRALAGQCGVHRLGKEIEKTLDKALHTLENSIIRNGEQLLLK